MKLIGIRENLYTYSADFTQGVWGNVASAVASGAGGVLHGEFGEAINTSRITITTGFAGFNQVVATPMGNDAVKFTTVTYFKLISGVATFHFGIDTPADRGLTFDPATGLISYDATAPTTAATFKGAPNPPFVKRMLDGSWKLVAQFQGDQRGGSTLAAVAYLVGSGTCACDCALQIYRGWSPRKYVQTFAAEENLIVTQAPAFGTPGALDFSVAANSMFLGA